MDLHYNFPNREEIEVLKESKLLSQVIWSGSTFHTLAALDEKVFCPKPVLLTMGIYTLIYQLYHRYTILNIDY